MPNILIVEDDPNISGLYSYTLKKRGYVVARARDAEEGLSLLDMVRPNLIILDLLMPGDNGVEFLRKANLEKTSPGTKVLVVSNVDSPEFAKQLKPFHVADYLIKAEYTPHRIVEVVEKLLGREAGILRLPWTDRVRRWFTRDK